MTKTRAHTKCRRCGHRFDEHTLPALDCPDGSTLQDGQVSTFQKHVPRVAVSNSFTAAELEVATQILEGLTRKRDLTHLVKNAAFSNLARKVNAMRARVAEQRKERESA